ncbi:threonine ammonia-lyase, biosynthetic [Pseudomonas sp. R11F]|uniref:L-threonine dehydratase n=1 Tax=Pseudomonas palleroniana TaxID=191390 RepID=A0A2L1J4S6_9PSED|nr:MULTISPECIES: threonine ammonia-lyase, biosynthetic [Pseudomonas]AVE03477.1 threonine ammonia-lyase, biosynthetic [Pseudomonas palleroniana]MBM9485183.1 threonine ammonia-lyase, biosynthetic [Pseudomonas sp. ICBG1301]UOK36450.1 threonine ammonia-lyase, biosynthetic [Pseudomonas palleroniana]
MTTRRAVQATDTSLLEHYVKKILAAPVYDLAVRTPLQAAPALSALLGNQVLLKREDLQPTFSFKIRGAYNRLVQLTAEQKARGVVTASAGNHAQGVALAARELGIRARIVMPCTTPELKVLGVRSRGADAVLHGESFPLALAHALQLVETSGCTFVSPFDDPDVIAGQGTVAMEILRQQQGPLDAIFVPVGGGGLIAGIAAYVKYLRPQVRIVGVESEGSSCLLAALQAGERVVLPSVDGFADGTAVAQIGAYGFEICRNWVDEVITVSNDELCSAIKLIYDDTRAITEPSGALAVAGLRRYVAQRDVRGQTLVAVNSGANINFDSLRHVAERVAAQGPV